MQTPPADNAFQKISDWLPLGLIILGLLLDWIGVPYAGIVFVAGFLSYLLMLILLDRLILLPRVNR